MKITIEGSITPSVYLASGERVTVERTAFIDNLLRRGYVTEVESPPEPATQSEDIDSGIESREADASEPSRNASRTEWESFLADQGVAFREDSTRADLIRAWADRSV